MMQVTNINYYSRFFIWDVILPKPESNYADVFIDRVKVE